jgi:hypothetical protein
MDLFDWVLLLIAGLCFGLVFLLVWLGPPSRHPGLYDRGTKQKDA